MRRPPEKIIRMPTSPTSPNADVSKRPARARTSLLSIISHDKKGSTSSSEGALSPTSPSPKSPTVTSTTPKSPTLTSPTVSSPSSSVSSPAVSPPTSPTVKTEANKGNDDGSKRKSIPPPVLTKPTKPKPPATAQKPSRPESKVPEIITEEIAETKSSSQSEPEETPKEAMLAVAAEAPIAETEETPQVQISTDVETKAPKVELSATEPELAPPPEIVSLPMTQECHAEVPIDEKVTKVESSITHESHENGTNITLPTSSVKDDADVTIESLPPPPPELASVELVPEITMEDPDVSMDFPPPPDADFPAPPPELTDLPPPTEMENAPPADPVVIEEALDKIQSKYDVSPVSLMTNTTYQSDEIPYQEANISSVDNGVQSEQSGVELSPADKTLQPVSNTLNDKQSDIIISAPQHEAPTDNVNHSVDVPDKAAAPLSLQLNTELSPAPTHVEAKSPSISSPLSEVSQQDSEMSVQDNYFDAEMPAPPAVEQTSVDNNNISSLDAQRTEKAADNASGEGTSHTTLTVAKVQEAELHSSTSGVPVHHSPPFNSSSESGDSGVYSLVGETVQVKLRPTTNDNRKAELNTVPMFDRNSGGELKRVTFRETSNQQQITPAATPRTAREEERVKKTGLSEQDTSQTELFYKAHKTEVMVCQCLATLYFAEGASGDSVTVHDWKPEHIGIPVLIYDTGDGKRSRGLTLVFAEKGTGFSLWKTVINYESRWEVVENVFHRLRVPGTGDQLAGMAFQDEESATSFYNYFKTCTADPEKNVLNNPNLRNKKKEKKKKPQKSVKAPALPTKSAISRPCEFQHVTQLKQSEEGILALSMVPADEDGSEDGMR